MRLLIVGAATACLVSPATAQLPFPTPRQDSVRTRDTIPVPAYRMRPPITPLAAAGRSLLVPGWGQIRLGRRITGAAFVFWEGLTLGMTLKAARQLSYLERIGDSARVEGKRQELQDWAVLLVFNHLLAGAEAYVSASLWDFPIELEARPVGGGAALGVRVRRR